MSNSFVKEERVAFEDILEGFEDQGIMADAAHVFRTDSQDMERAGDVIWRPQPYIAQSFDGMDQTLNFKEYVQLAVPATLGYSKSVPWILDAKELRDAFQEKSLGKAARQKIASDINIAVLNVAALQGTLVVKRTTAATGFDDLALADSMLNEQGVGSHDRVIALTSRAYNSMASNLASRSTMTGKPEKAYENGYVGRVGAFDTYKLDYSKRIPAAGGSGITISTLDAAVSYWIPKATSTAGTGERNNVDNRYQSVTVSSTTGVNVGDAFTIAGVNAVHHITKEDTGQLKTFRVIAVNSGTSLTISPPIVSNQVANDASKIYQNCVVNTKAANSAITFLNTVASQANPFWVKDAIEILPGHYAVDGNAGVNVLRGTTSKGIEVVMQKFYDINTMKTKFRLDCLFGVCNKQPEMSGIILFDQV